MSNASALEWARWGQCTARGSGVGQLHAMRLQAGPMASPASWAITAAAKDRRATGPCELFVLAAAPPPVPGNGSWPAGRNRAGPERTPIAPSCRSCVPYRDEGRRKSPQSRQLLVGHGPGRLMTCCVPGVLVLECGWQRVVPTGGECLGRMQAGKCPGGRACRLPAIHATRAGKQGDTHSNYTRAGCAAL